MLDVHPPHKHPNSWREFFIHIATIVLGLLIAVALEQSVEYLNRRHELTETRQALQNERNANYKHLTDETTFWRWGVTTLENNLLVLEYLQQHPGTPQENLPGVLIWSNARTPFTHVVWDTAQQDNVLAMMPREEAARNARLYTLMEKIGAASEAAYPITLDAAQYRLTDPNPSHLTPAQVATEIELTRKAINAEVVLGSAMLNFRAAFPDFPATVTPEDLSAIEHRFDEPDRGVMHDAEAKTFERLNAVGYTGTIVTSEGAEPAPPHQRGPGDHPDDRIRR